MHSKTQEHDALVDELVRVHKHLEEVQIQAAPAGIKPTTSTKGSKRTAANLGGDPEVQRHETVHK